MMRGRLQVPRTGLGRGFGGGAEGGGASGCPMGGPARPVPRVHGRTMTPMSTPFREGTSSIADSKFLFLGLMGARR